MDIEFDAGMFLSPAAAILCGFVLGWNRERKGRAAGLRTQILVTLGSAVLVMAGIRLQSHFPGVGYDLSRVISGVAGGIGFLGAGSIIRMNDGIRGVTTAATVWMSGAIGILCGMQWYSMAAIIVAYTLVVLVLFGFISDWLEPSKEEAQET